MSGMVPEKIIKKFCVDCHKSPGASCNAPGSGERARSIEKAKACGCMNCRNADLSNTGGHRAFYEVEYVRASLPSSGSGRGTGK